MIELVEQDDNLVVHWRSDVLAVLYDDLLELLIPCISLIDSEFCSSKFLVQLVDLVEQAIVLCLEKLELVLKLDGLDRRIRTGRLLLFTIRSADE